MSRMTNTLEHLRDYAWDLEADLGKIARNRVANPHFGDVQKFVADGTEPSDIRTQNLSLTAQTLAAYKNAATAAPTSANTDDLTTADSTTLSEIRGLVRRIVAVKSYEDAAELVASFNA